MSYLLHVYNRLFSPKIRYIQSLNIDLFLNNRIKNLTHYENVFKSSKKKLESCTNKYIPCNKKVK